MNVERLAPFFRELRNGLRAAGERSEPRIGILTPGPLSATYFEQAYLARYLGFLLVEGDDLVVRDGRVFVRTIAGLKRCDVLWRHVDAEWCDPLELNAASRIGVPGLIEAIRAGGVAVENMPGSGLLESRALLAFLPAPRPPAARRRARHAQHRHLVVRPAQRARPGAGRTRHPFRSPAPSPIPSPASPAADRSPPASFPRPSAPRCARRSPRAASISSARRSCACRRRRAGRTAGWCRGRSCCASTRRRRPTAGG